MGPGLKHFVEVSLKTKIDVDLIRRVEHSCRYEKDCESELKLSADMGFVLHFISKRKKAKLVHLLNWGHI